MIPIIIITESGESFNYFEGVGKDDFKDTHVIRGTRCEIRFNDKQLRDKVLELLHEEASELCYENTIGCIIPACFQIHIKDIIEKAKGETE